MELFPYDKMQENEPGPLLGRFPKVDLIILKGENIRPSVRPYVRPFTKSFFNLNEIWYIGRGR